MAINKNGNKIRALHIKIKYFGREKRENGEQRNRMDLSFWSQIHNNAVIFEASLVSNAPVASYIVPFMQAQ